MSTAPEVILTAEPGERVGECAQVQVPQPTFATDAVIEITAEEKLSVSRLENSFLRAQSEIKRLQGEIEAAQRQFPQVIQALVDKYNINVVTHVFDNVALEFRRK